MATGKGLKRIGQQCTHYCTQSRGFGGIGGDSIAPVSRGSRESCLGPEDFSNPSPSAIVVFLRGVNVGGHKKIAMAALKSAFESMGFRNVRTVLASGNVVFEAPGKDARLDQTISRGLEGAFGFPIKVVLRTVRELQAMVAADPFKGVPLSPDVRLYVTFLAQRTPGRSRFSLPAPSKGVRIVRVRPGEIFSAVTLSPGVGTPDLMARLDKALGDAATTRNWNTIVKITGPHPR